MNGGLAVAAKSCPHRTEKRARTVWSQKLTRAKWTFDILLFLGSQMEYNIFKSSTLLKMGHTSPYPRAKYEILGVFQHMVSDTDVQ